MWPRSGPEPVIALDLWGARITRQPESWPMRDGVCDVKSINGSVRAVRGGRRGQRDHNIASKGQPSLPDPGVHSDTLLILPTNTSWHGIVWSIEKSGAEYHYDSEAVTTMRQRNILFKVVSWLCCVESAFSCHFLQNQLSKSFSKIRQMMTILHTKYKSRWYWILLRAVEGGVIHWCIHIWKCMARCTINNVLSQH